MSQDTLLLVDDNAGILLVIRTAIAAAVTSFMQTARGKLFTWWMTRERKYWRP